MSKSHLAGLLATAMLLGSSESPVRASGATAEVVIAWNQVLRDTIPGTVGPTAPRYFATLHVAMFDAINAIERDFEPFRTAVRHASGSPEAAAAQAAHDVLVGLFPASTAIYDGALAQQLGPRPSGFVRRGAAVGALVAKATLDWRQNDGWLAPAPAYVLPPFPGLWQPTPPGFSVAALTQAPTVEPFGILTPTQFLPPPPPTLTSERYAADFIETKLVGRFDSTARMPDQTALARLWAGIGANGVGTATGLFDTLEHRGPRSRPGAPPVAGRGRPPVRARQRVDPRLAADQRHQQVRLRAVAAGHRHPACRRGHESGDGPRHVVAVAPEHAAVSHVWRQHGVRRRRRGAGRWS